ncbi:superoxide dismutase [Cu-Zn]-like [Harmonia axyridis]|uniref:superoxide dismutase [Cu-Zn]-like n=1 Tax=Harmonia axyridis TaxID=115357 RepID=UPI001E278CE0|nr:superoxide dismutase [Cu-Zn]-like [Harmonia axyridis]
MKIPIVILVSLITMYVNVSSKTEPVKKEPVEKAVCVLLSPFNSVNGLITFEKLVKGIQVTGKISGLDTGPHALHIHEKGDIRDPKCLTVGGHFNPLHKQHGALEDKVRHMGDLGNINADEQGIAVFSFVDKQLLLEGPNSIIGRSLVVHSKIDDLGRGNTLESKTTGASGERIACGVIGYA